MTEERLIRVEESMKHVEVNVRSMQQAVTKMAEHMGQLALLEERHNKTAESIARSFKAIEDHEARIRIVEGSLPSIRIASGWVFKAALAIIGILGMFAVGVIIRLAVP